MALDPTDLLAAEDDLDVLDGSESVEQVDRATPAVLDASTAGPSLPLNPPATRPMPAPVVPGNVTPLSEAEYRTSVLRMLSAVNTKLERLVQAMEGLRTTQTMAPPQPAAAPPVTYAPQVAQPVATLPDPSAGWLCPIHGVSKVIPAGQMRKPPFRQYPAFYVCAIDGCTQRPPR